MGIRFEVENMKETQSKMAAVTSRITQAVKGGQEDEAEELFDEIVKTSPVDTGDYQDAWEMEEQGDTILLINDEDHAQYLVFPNQRQVGSAKADDPARGIQHNVRGIIKKHEGTFRSKIASRIKSVLR